MPLLAAASIIALISACGSGGSGGSGPTPTTELTEVNLALLGGPLTSAGHVEESTAVVTVRDTDGALVRFDASNVVQETGEFTEFEADSNEGAVRLYLPEGKAFSFHALAYDQGGASLASGETERVVVTASRNSWTIELVSIMGTAQLAPRLPTTFVIPGQELDVTLAVSASRRPELKVPAKDYEAEYSVANGTALAGPSGRGLRLRVGDRAEGDVEVVATVSGSVDTADGPAEGNITASLRLPFQTTVVVDTQPPTLSDLAYDPERGAFTGVASDDMGVAVLSVWDGPVPLATTDLQDVNDLGVPEVIFPGGGTAFLTYIDLPAGDYTLTVVSADYTGNETSLDLAVTVP